jgi:hypothetical protein
LFFVFKFQANLTLIIKPKMKTKSILLVLLMLAMTSFFSCTKDDTGSVSGSTINYVIKATYDNPQDHSGMTNAEVTHLALTTPSGSNSVSENSTTPISIGSDWGKYKSGMTVTATCESVLSHVTVTVEIWRDGVLWKHQTVLGSANYTDVTVTGAL